MTEKSKYVGNYRIHCHKCGRFVGEDGFIDVYDNEEGYSLCGLCLRNEKEAVI